MTATEVGTRSFAASDKIAAALDAVMAATAEIRRGEVIEYETIEELSGIERYGRGWNTLVKKLKKRFEAERRITLWHVTNVGYKLVTVSEQLHDCPLARSRRAARQLSLGLGHMESLPVEELNDHEQAIRANKMAAQRRAMKEVRRSRAMHKALMNPPGRG